MKTIQIPAALAACACLAFAAPANAAYAPAKITSMTVAFTGTKATYPDDRGRFVVVLTSADLTTGSFRYSGTSPDEGRLSFTKWDGYTGAFDMTFTSPNTGTFYKRYRGPYNGYISGSFVIDAMESPDLPVANSTILRLKKNQTATFRLTGKGYDIPKKKLTYRIIQQPSSGKLITNRLPQVTFKPKRGFTGTVKFKFTVKEGRTESKPATVTIKIK